jgi:phosphoserine phosphatase
MASLRDVVSEYQDDLRNGIAWLAFWREGRSWQAEAFHLDLDDTLYPEDRARLAEIQAADPQAVVVNGYYSGYLSEEMGVTELAAGVRHHYDNGLNNITPVHRGPQRRAAAGYVGGSAGKSPCCRTAVL